MTVCRHLLMGVLIVTGVSCGDSDQSSDDAAPPIAAARITVADRVAPHGDPKVAGQAISGFGTELFEAVRASKPGENVAVSPTSVAYALAMLEPGANGGAQTQLRALLHIDDVEAFHASMNTLEQDLEARVPTSFSDGDDPGEVVMRIANAAYLQKGYPFESAYLDRVGADYGPVLNEADFLADPDAVAHDINAFVADSTNDKIPHLVPDGAIAPDTVLALVNALYLRASWQSTFDEAATTNHPFTALDGATQTVSMMNGGSDASSAGDGWVGATKSYVGGLSVQFILPDEGRFDDVADDLDRVLAEFATNRTIGSTLGLPRFQLRFGAELSPALRSLGLTAPYAEGGLMGIAHDPQLIIDQVIHQTYVAMDEKGTEAAAATVVLGRATGAPVTPPAPVILDRPFLYRIVDDSSGATLFIGQVLDPLS